MRIRNNRRAYLIPIWATVSVMVMMYGACNNRGNINLFELGNTTSTESPEQHIERLQKELNKRNDYYQKVLQAAADIADHHKLLGLAYMKNSMFALALQSLQEALIIEPHNEILYYLSGLAAANLAQIHQPRTTEYNDLIALAEYMYTQSIELRDNYLEPLYALSVLYLFEYQLEEQALIYLERSLMLNDQQPRIHALIARVYAQTNNNERAIYHYQKAAQMFEDEEKIANAHENIRILESVNP